MIPQTRRSKPKVLALDLGAKTGWALRDTDGSIKSGVWNLEPKKSSSFKTRWLSLWHQITKLGEAGTGLDEIAFEKVERHPRPVNKLGRHVGMTATNIYAAHCYGGYKALVEMYGDYRDIAIYSYSVAAIKKHATGKGNARKELMLAAARAKWNTDRIKDDNQADALWILDLHLRRGES